MKRRPAVGGSTALALALLAAGAGCHSGGGSRVVAAFAGSGAGAAANVVRLTGQASGDEVIVSVVIGGTTTSSDLYSFAFGLDVGDPDVVEYVAGSATFGSALTLGGGQTGEALATQSGGLVTVGVTKLGGGTGNGVGAGESAIVRLTFRVRAREQTTIAIAGQPAALDSSGAPVPSVQFDLNDAAISGS